MFRGYNWPPTTRQPCAGNRRPARVVIEDDEALHADPPRQDQACHARQPVRTGRRRRIVVMRNESAHRHARVHVEQRRHRIEHRATDVLEVDIDAARAGCRQSLRQVGLAVIDAGIESKLLDHVAALLRAAGDAHGPTALQPGQLAHHRADAAARGRDHHGFARRRLADVQQTDEGGETRHAEHAERAHRLPQVHGKFPQSAAVGQRVAPASRWPRAPGRRWRIRGGVNARRATRWRQPLPRRWRPTAHTRAHRSYGRACTDRSTGTACAAAPDWPRLLQLEFLEPEILQRRLARWARVQHDAAIAHPAHSPAARERSQSVRVIS